VSKQIPNLNAEFSEYAKIIHTEGKKMVWKNGNERIKITYSCH
jgi:hypothetical protein